MTSSVVEKVRARRKPRTLKGQMSFSTWIDSSVPPSDKELEVETVVEPERPEILPPANFFLLERGSQVRPCSLFDAVIAGCQSDEVTQILRAWHEILGIELDADEVREHLKKLQAWQARWNRQ